MEEVIYGDKTSIIMEKFESPPPENIFKRPKKSLPDINCSSRKVSIPGIGIEAIRRNKTKTKKVNKILFLKTLSSKINFVL